MILLWFILGVALIFGIARYNESNKLFWTLLISFVMGFAGAKMINDVHFSNDEQSNDCLTQVCSTQMPMASLSTTAYFITDAMPKASNVVTAHKSVSQGFTPATCETNVTLSEVFGGIRDQPRQLPTKPPEPCLQKDFLILHDTG